MSGAGRPPTDAASQALRSARLTHQGLVDRAAPDPETVVRSLLAVQAQDPRGARLAVRARSTGLTAADVDAALSDRRSLVVGWLLRGTLHLVAAEDYWWLHALTAPRMMAGTVRRLGQEGVSAEQAERGVAVIADALAVDGALTRAELAVRLDDAGVPTAGQALVHVLAKASIEEVAVRGPMVGRHQAFVDPVRWIGPRPAIDLDDARARLALRYLAGHGPADAADLAKWSGIPLGDARRGLAALDGTALDGTGLDGTGLDGTGLDDGDGASMPAPRLLGPFDPTLHGWASRRLLVGDDEAGVVTSNGIFRSTALVDGVVVATWSSDGGRVLLHPRWPVSLDVVDELAVDADDVARFLGVAPGGLDLR